jgi:hypothetical protein
MYHYFKIPYFTCNLFTKFTYNEYIGPYFLSHVVLRFSPSDLPEYNPLLTGSMNITPIRIQLHIVPTLLKVKICMINYKGQDFLLFEWVIKYFQILPSIRCSSILETYITPRTLMSRVNVFRVINNFACLTPFLTCITNCKSFYPLHDTKSYVKHSSI